MLGTTTLTTSRKREAIAKNVTDHPTTTGTASRAFTHVDILYTSFHSISYKTFIQHKLKAADSLKRAVLSIVSSLHR